MIKTEQLSDHDQMTYKRPYITDDDVLVVSDANNPIVMLPKQTNRKYCEHILNKHVIIL